MLWNDPFEPLVSQFNRVPAYFPPTDVTVNEGDLVLTMDVPGLSHEDLSIELVDGYLVVRGERLRPQAQDGNLAHRERAFGKFERRVKVPDGVDGDAITATIEHGVLSLLVPKPDRLRPRTIRIQTAQGSGDLDAAPQQRELGATT